MKQLNDGGLEKGTSHSHHTRTGQEIESLPKLLANSQAQASDQRQ